MTRYAKNTSMELLLVAVLFLAACCAPAQGQTLPSTILEIDVVNLVTYQNDAGDYSKLATDPNQVPGVPAKNFSYFVGVGDIIAVNGKPAKGTAVGWNASLNMTPTPAPGQMIADTTRASVRIVCFEILQPDGTPVGSIMTEGFGGGPRPPGAPLSATQGNHAITGGTGAFLGVRGEFGSDASRNVAIPTASVNEDPANRRLRSGGATHFVLHLIPMFQPQIATTSSGPAVAHSSDFTPVTAAKPAAAGEILSLFATGLGPTRPGVDPGQPFPASAPAAVTSPIAVTVNGKQAEVLAAVSYPGAVDGYQVNFRVPPDAAKGTATIQLSAAWIAGSTAQISIQ